MRVPRNGSTYPIFSEIQGTLAFAIQQCADQVDSSDLGCGVRVPQFLLSSPANRGPNWADGSGVGNHARVSKFRNLLPLFIAFSGNTFGCVDGTKTYQHAMPFVRCSIYLIRFTNTPPDLYSTIG